MARNPGEAALLLGLDSRALGPAGVECPLPRLASPPSRRPVRYPSRAQTREAPRQFIAQTLDSIHVEECVSASASRRAGGWRPRSRTRRSMVAACVTYVPRFRPHAVRVCGGAGPGAPWLCALCPAPVTPSICGEPTRAPNRMRSKHQRHQPPAPTHSHGSRPRPRPAWGRRRRKRL